MGDVSQQINAFADIAVEILSKKKLAAAPEDLQASVTEGIVALLDLRHSHRCALLDIEAMKEETARNKQKTEQVNLQLQNLLYEKRYYEKQIAVLQQFKSKYTDEQMGMLSEEEFRRVAPADVQAKLATADDHQVMLERLSHELAQRKLLLTQLDKARQEKQRFEQILQTKKQQLDTVKLQLKDLGTAAQPLQSELQLVEVQLKTQKPQASLLPLPLYILYCQLVAASEAFGLNLEVDVQGSMEEAELLAKTPVASTCNGDMDRDDEDDVQTRKRPRIESVSSSGLAKEHPLKVVMKLLTDSGTSNGGTASMGVVFSYIMSMKVVAAAAVDAADEEVLTTLFPDDDGASLPANAFAGGTDDGSSGVSGYNATVLGRPYKWAQHLAGLDFLPQLPQQQMLTGGMSAEQTAATTEQLARYREQRRVPNVVRRLRECKAGVSALNAQLESLLVARPPRLPTTNGALKHSKLHRTIIFQVASVASPSAPKPLPSSSTSTHRSAAAVRAAAQPSQTPPSTPPRPQLVAPMPPHLVDTRRSPASQSNQNSIMIAEDGEIVEVASPNPVDRVDRGDTKMDVDQSNGATSTDAGDGEAEHSSRADALRMPTRCFNITLRSVPLELVAKVTVFLDYFGRPPVVEVTKVSRLPHKSPQADITNLVDVQLLSIHHEVNVRIVQDWPKKMRHVLLGAQLQHLCACLDAMAATFADASPQSLPATNARLFSITPAYELMVD